MNITTVGIDVITVSDGLRRLLAMGNNTDSEQ